MRQFFIVFFCLYCSNEVFHNHRWVSVDGKFYLCDENLSWGWIPNTFTTGCLFVQLLFLALQYLLKPMRVVGSMEVTLDDPS